MTYRMTAVKLTTCFRSSNGNTCNPSIDKKRQVFKDFSVIFLFYILMSQKARSQQITFHVLAIQSSEVYNNSNITNVFLFKMKSWIWGTFAGYNWISWQWNISHNSYNYAEYSRLLSLTKNTCHPTVMANMFCEKMYAESCGISMRRENENCWP